MSYNYLILLPGVLSWILNIIIIIIIIIFSKIYKKLFSYLLGYFQNTFQPIIHLCSTTGTGLPKTEICAFFWAKKFWNKMFI